MCIMKRSLSGTDSARRELSTTGKEDLRAPTTCCRCAACYYSTMLGPEHPSNTCRLHSLSSPSCSSESAPLPPLDHWRRIIDYLRKTNSFPPFISTSSVLSFLFIYLSSFSPLSGNKNPSDCSASPDAPRHLILRLLSYKNS